MTPGDADGSGRAVPQGLDEGSPQAARLARHDRQQVHGRLEPVPRSTGRAITTGVDAETLRRSARASRAARRVHAAPRVQQVVANRARWRRVEMPLDWGCAETLAYAALLEDGCEIRSPARTAAAARSSIATPCCTTRDRRTYVPLQHLRRAQPRFHGHDSVLSEEAVLGFEYGYSTTDPNCARDLGRAVRRLRERRAGDHRPVHQLRRDPSGAASAAWCCSCRTATKARAPSIRRRVSSASCSCAPRTTCRCACRRRRRRCSTCCGGRCCAASQAAHRHDAEEPAAARAVGLGARKSSRAAVSRT
jgi:hypothetical protein